MVKLDKKISMNPDLLDPREVMIGRLKSKIEAFKKYDEERKSYYREALIKLGELESLIDESDPERKLRDKIKNQKKVIQSLQAKLVIKNVDFPVPFTPTTPILSPSLIPRVTSSKSVLSPYIFVIFSRFSIFITQ